MRFILTATATLVLGVACSLQPNEDLDVCFETRETTDGDANSFVAGPDAVYFARNALDGVEVVRADRGLEVIDGGATAVEFFDAAEGSVLYSIGRGNQPSLLALYSRFDGITTIDSEGSDLPGTRRSRIDGGRVVWSRGGSVYVRDGDGVRRFGDGESARDATAANGRIVWTQNVDGVRQVFELIRGVPVARTVGGQRKLQPLVSGDTLAWIEHETGVFVTRGEQTTNLFAGRCFELSGTDELLAFSCREGELYAAPRDGSVTRIASVGGAGGGLIHSPRVAGNRVAWIQPDDWNGEDINVAAGINVWEAGEQRGIARLASRCRLCSFVGPEPRVDLSSGFAIWNYADADANRLDELEYAARCDGN